MTLKYIRERREELGLTQKKLSSITKVSQNHISMIERGEMSPTVTTLEKLAPGLKTSVKTIIEKSEELIKTLN